MEIPLQVTFREMSTSDAVVAACQEAADGLERFGEHITRCHVTVASPHRHQTKGTLFSVHVDMTLPGHKEIVVSNDGHDKHAHADVYVAIRDAFRAAERQLRKISDQRGGHARRTRVARGGEP